MIVLIDAENSFYKIQSPLIKYLAIRDRRNMPQWNKGHMPQAHS